MEAATSNIIAESLPFTSNFNSYDNTYSEFGSSSYSFNAMLRFDLKKYVKEWKSRKNLVLVTHYVVISEALDYSSSSGEIVISDKNFNIINSIEIKY